MRPASKVRLRPNLLFVRALCLLSTSICVYSLVCFECLDTGPINNACTPETHNCTGAIACVRYEHIENKTSAAFCLYGFSGFEKQLDVKFGKEGGTCWKVDDGGFNCICRRDFCNKPRDISQIIKEDNAEIFPGLNISAKNPFVDYEYIEDESKLGESMDNSEEINTTSTVTAPANLTKNSSVEEFLDNYVDVEFDENNSNDLAPVEFQAYLDWEQAYRFNGTRIPLGTRYNVSRDVAGRVASSGSLPLFTALNLCALIIFVKTLCYC